LNKKLKNIATYIIFLGIGLFLFYRVYKGVDPKEMWAEMQKANLWYIGASFVMGYLAIVSRGIRWKLLLQPMGYNPNIWNSIHSVAFAYFSNTFVPRSGELARCGALNQTDDIPVDKLFGTVITERVIDFIMLFIFMAIALFGSSAAFLNLMDEASLDASKMKWIWIGGIMAVVGFSALIMLRKRLMSSALGQKIRPFLLGIREGLISVFKMKRKWAFIGHTVFIWLMYYGMSYVVFQGIPGLEDTPPMLILIVMIAGGLGMIFPSPGGIGSYHGATEFAFDILGLGLEIGKVYAAIVWFTQAAMIIITGGIGLAWITIVKVKKRNLSAHGKKPD
jgi:glycosyltransferase 2 family protein